MSYHSSKWLWVTVPYPHVLHIELRRDPVNAFSREFWLSYGELFDKISSDILNGEQDIRAIVVSSAFPRTFTAGIDTSALFSTVNGPSQGSEPTPDPARNFLRLRADIQAFQHAIGAPERVPVPVIMAVHGNVLGLGIDMMCYADIRYAAGDAKFSIKEVDVGLAADIGTLALFPKITGNYSLARELAYTARPFDAQTALNIGFISKIAGKDREDVIKEALTLATVIAAKPPIAVAGTKQLITQGRDATVAQSLEYTKIWNSGALQTDDMAQVFQSLKSKQPAKFAPVGTKAKL